jgi:hypothetical protein
VPVDHDDLMEAVRQAAEDVGQVVGLIEGRYDDTDRHVEPQQAPTRDERLI